MLLTPVQKRGIGFTWYIPKIISSNGCYISYITVIVQAILDTFIPYRAGLSHIYLYDA
jgi:hypothetical protein